VLFFFFSSRRRHTRFSRDWSSDVCSSDLNVLIPAFAVGRTQDLLYLMAEHYADWRLDRWRVFLDSPMGIEATGIYSVYRHLYKRSEERRVGKECRARRWRCQ